MVTSEVRNFAQRPTDGAKEIKALLETSVSKVRRTIAGLNDAVKNVATITTAIAATASEHTRTIDEVNRAVTSMDQSTQQNAALVEEIAAASESLSTLGWKLHTTVSLFRL